MNKSLQLKLNYLIEGNKALAKPQVNNRKQSKSNPDSLKAKSELRHHSIQQANMEVIQLLEMCQKNFTTVKQAFSRLGLLEFQDGNRPFSELTEKEEFAYLMNWIINQMKKDESVLIRYKADGNTYQMNFFYHNRQIRVKKPKIISNNKNFTSYIWTDEDTYNQLTTHKIMESIQRADEEAVDQLGESSTNTGKGIRAENQQELTDDDYELVESFLENV